MSTIEIQLRNESGQYRCGDLVEGTVNWQGLETDCEAIVIRLIWFTRGKGNRDHEVIAEKPVHQPSPDGGESFEFTAPDFPVSIAGKLISVIWAVEVICYPDLQAKSHEVVIGPDAQPVHWPDQPAERTS